MNVSGQTTSPLDASALWTELREPERLARALPGVDLVDVLDERTMRAHIAPVTGLGVTPFQLEVRIDEERPPRSCRIAGAGRSGEHAVEFDLTIDLAPGDGGTTVTWSGDFRFLGVLGSIGQRVLPHIVADQVNSAVAAAGTSSVR